jgi:hypothetical protein
VQHPRSGNPLHHLSLHSFPDKVSTFLAPSAQGAQPGMADLCSEGIQGFSVPRNCVIIEMSLDHCPQPSSLFWYRLVPVTLKGLADLFDFTSKSFADGLA